MICDPSSLLRSARCFRCLPKSELNAALIYTLCQWANAEACDPDAVAYLEAAGIDPASTDGRAVCQLVADLKAYPAAQPVGNRYWDRETLIYPFVGGTAASHAVNLKTPGTNDLTYVGAGLTHDALGMKGDGVASYARTGYLIANQNSIRTMVYVDLLNPTDSRYYYGTADNAFLFRYRLRRTGANFEVSVNDATTTPFAATSLGAIFVERFVAGSRQCANAAGNWVAQPVASTGLSPRFLTLLADNNAGVAPVGTAGAFADGRISGFSLGAPLDTGGGNAERLEYKGIWDRFQAALSTPRAHP